jgi:ParB family transcriptional regulator, chromosome partitioning protein
MPETRSKATRRRFTVDSLFTDTSARGVGVEELPEARLIRIERIIPDPEQPRRYFDDERLAELAASVKAEGVLQPIAVRYDETRDIYVIIHGERRWRAAALAGLAALPAVVREISAERRLIQQLMENIVREDLSALDRAAALRALKEQMGNPSWEVVADAVGIRRSRLFQLLDTEKLEATIQEALRRGLVSEKQTRAIHRLFPEIQAELGERVLAGELAARDLPGAAREILDGAASTTKSPAAASHSRPVQAATRQAAALAKSLAALDTLVFERLDDAAQIAFADRLSDLRAQVDETIDRLLGPR